MREVINNAGVSGIESYMFDMMQTVNQNYKNLMFKHNIRLSFINLAKPLNQV